MPTTLQKALPTQISLQGGSLQKEEIGLSSQPPKAPNQTVLGVPRISVKLQDGSEATRS
jgi:hypothetical protein